MPSLHFKAHLQFTQAIAQPKIAKEPLNPSRKIKKQLGKNKNFGMLMNNGQQVTHGIVHAGFRGTRAFVARKKYRCKLIGNCFELPHDTIPSNVTCKPMKRQCNMINEQIKKQN